jgi:hypothetical protein
MDDLTIFCCQNPQCPDYGRRGLDNLRICFRNGCPFRKCHPGYWERFQGRTGTDHPAPQGDVILSLPVGNRPGRTLPAANAR